MLEELGLDLESGEESNESEDDLSNFTSPPTTASKPAKKKPVSKHELVFVSGAFHSYFTFVTSVLVFIVFFLKPLKLLPSGSSDCYIVTCAKVLVLTSVRLFATQWAGARQTPLSMEFSRQEYWNGLPFPLQRIFQTRTPVSCIAGRFFYYMSYVC